MVQAKVSIKYASSLLDLAFEGKIDKQISDEIESVLEVIAVNQQLKKVLQNPIIKSDIKQNIIEKIFKGKISKELFDFISFIVKKNREDILSEILLKYIDLRNERLGIAKVDILSSAGFDDKQTENLLVKLEKILNKKVLVNFKIDSSLIGGFIAKTGDTIIDASLKHQLEILRKQFFKSGMALS
jgi:F-type H+-transporting ATPase subunit delta